MNKYIKYIKILLVLTSVSGILALIDPMTFKEFGSISWALLIIVMFIRPISNIFPKCKLFSFVGKFRRELGILVGMFGIAHVVGYIKLMQYPTFYGFFTDFSIWNVSGMLFWGMMGFLVSIPLLVTSNSFATRLFGKHWKTLQRLAYFMFVFVGLHIYLIEKDIGPLVVVGFWILLWIIALIKNKKTKKNTSTGPKWLCVPCGYIYDENIGDPDGGIAAGTKFEDIPDTWRCPVCGVGKGDFILIEGEIKVNESKIVSLEYLTEDVIELQVDLQKEVSFTSGQFLTFTFKDANGEFNRSYSIANKVGNVYTFLIKLKSDGRAGILFRTKKVGDKLNYTNISGSFKLKDTKNPKVFIATGTGLAPIYNMLLNTPEVISKKIYFGVANLKDMFYVENLRKIKDLEINLFLSREEVSGYNFGRMDFSKYEFEKNTEFYICGNPGVVQGAKKTLDEKGFTDVFSEEF